MINNHKLNKQQLKKNNNNKFKSNKKLLKSINNFNNNRQICNDKFIFKYIDKSNLKQKLYKQRQGAARLAIFFERSDDKYQNKNYINY